MRDVVKFRKIILQLNLLNCPPIWKACALRLKNVDHGIIFKSDSQ